MPTEPLQDAEGRNACPACGSRDTRQVSAEVVDRLRNAIAAHWAEAPSPPGPDGRWLRAALIAWVGTLAFALVTSTSHFVDRWAWGALLLGALVLGAWSDRLAARRRGWIDPMQRAAAIVQRARARDAMSREAADAAGVLGQRGERELICLHCGHRFEQSEPSVVSAA